MPHFQTAHRLMSEDLLNATQTRDEFPTRPSIATIRTWMQQGVNGTRLESIIIGGRAFTSRQAVARFIAALNGGQAQ